VTLKPFEVTLTSPGATWTETRIITVWVATAKAARESAALFAREEGIPDAFVSIRPLREYS